MSESIPILGYVASATHGIKGDKDRAKRAAGKCTTTTVVVTATIATYGLAGVAYSAATNPDGKITKMSESIPILGYVASATHGIKGDKDRAKRAAAKCTASTVKTGVAIGTGIAIATSVPTGGTSLAFVGAAAAAGAGAGATAGGVGLFAESQIAKGIKDESIKNQCKQGTAKEYAKAIAGGAVKGAIGGAMSGGAMDVLADQVDVVGDIVDGVKEVKEAIGIEPEVDDPTKSNMDKAMDKLKDDITGDLEDNAKGLCKAKIKEMYEKKEDWEYDPQQMDNIYIITGQGMKYICCDKSGKINCDGIDKNGTIFESIPHATDESKVALKSNGYYLFIDESKKGMVTTSKEIYYFKVLSYSNSKFSFVSQNGYYLYFKKKGGFGKGYKIAAKLKKDIKLTEIKFFVSNASK
eukprot:635294_1